MSKLQLLRAAALTSICFLQLGLVAEAQDNSENTTAAPQTAGVPSPSLGEITLGATGLTGVTGSKDSVVFGRYNGMTNSGVGANLSWGLHTQDSSDSGGTNYLSFTGNNVTWGLGQIAPEASINIETGQQGTWGISASYDAMTYTASNDFTTILNSNGTLSPGYQNALIGANAFFTNTPTNPSSLFGSFSGSTHLATANPITTFGPSNELIDTIGTRRDKGSLDGSYEVGDWLITTGISDEHKEGTLEQTMTTGGNNAGMVAFPMPINYDTSVYTAAAAYNTDQLQAKFSYVFSDFVDHNSGGYAFQGWNFSAYDNPSTKTFTSYEKNGDYSLPPSNQAHTFTAEIGYNVNSTTRVVSTAIYGLQVQNAPFVAATDIGYISSPAGASLAAQLATNATSLYGFVETFFYNLKVTSRPLSNLDLNASYKIDSRDPLTGSMWVYGDPTDTTALKYREAVPESWTKQEIDLTAKYHFMPETWVDVGYTFGDAQRSNAITAVALDNQVTADIHSTLTSQVTGSISFLHANRTTSAPNYDLWLEQIPADCGSTLVGLGCQQIPFYEAARTQDAINGNLEGMINEQTSFSLFGKYNNDDYHTPPAIYQASSSLPVTTNPSVGLNRDYSVQAGPDLNYQFDQTDEIHFYYTFLRNFRDFRALNNQTNTAGGNYYEVGSTYDIHTAGIGGTWQADDALKFVAEYTFSYAGEAFAQSGTWDLGYQGDPSLNTKDADNQFKLHAVYTFSPQTTFYLGYEFDSVDMNDFTLVGASVGQVLTGNVPPKYDVSKITAAFTEKL